MIVVNKGYLKLEDVIKLKRFCIYETESKKTHILVKEPGNNQEKITLYLPQKDRLPYKVIEQRKSICTANKIFDSEINLISEIDITKWNNGNQIMTYEDFNL